RICSFTPSICSLRPWPHASQHGATNSRLPMNDCRSDQSVVNVLSLTYLSLVRIHKSDLSRIQLHRNNIFYNLILNICELIYTQLIPTEKPARRGSRIF